MRHTTIFLGCRPFAGINSRVKQQYGFVYLFMVTRTHNFDSHGTAVTVALLTDDSNISAWLQHLLALDKSSQFNCQNFHPSNLDGDNREPTLQLLASADVIILDDEFSELPFIHTLQRIGDAISVNSTSHSQQKRAPQVLVLLDDDSVITQVDSLAQAARIGAQKFLLKSDISLRNLRSCIFSSQTDELPEPPKTSALTTSPTRELKTTEAVSLETVEQTITDSEYRHQLSVDLVNERIHISDIHLSNLLNEDQAMLSIQEWGNMLDAQGHKDFQRLIDNARAYRPLEDTISFSLTHQDSHAAPATISQIQINNDGQGRVVGLNATLTIKKNAKAYTAEVENPPGFDNLGDGKPFIDNDDALQNLTRSLPMICLLLDEHGVIVSVINAEADIQLVADFENGQLLTDALNIESEDNLTEAISRTLNTAKPYQQTIACATPSGVRWLDTHITKLKGNSGLTRQVVWTAFDITTSRLSYQELLKKHDTLSEIINNAPVMYFQLDNAQRFINANNAFCDIYSLRSDVIAGRNFQEVLDDEALTNFLTQISSDQNPTVLQYRKFRKDSEQQLLWKTLHTRSAASGTIESTIAFGLSVPADQPLPVNGDSAEPSNKNITAITTHTDNLTTSTLSLSGAVSQDFKSILNYIVSYTELALSQKNTGREAKFVDYINQVVDTSHRAKQLLDECEQDDADDDTAKTPSDPAGLTSTQLLPLTQEVIDTLLPTLPSTLSFNSDIDNGEDAAMVNPIEYRRIVLRLLAGARDDMAASQDATERGITMTLSAYASPAHPCDACDSELQGDYIALAVHSKTNKMDKSNITALINAAKQATKNRTADNVVAMTHHSHGHALIQFKEDTLSLIMLFPKAL